MGGDGDGDGDGYGDGGLGVTHLHLLTRVPCGLQKLYFPSTPTCPRAMVIFLRLYLYLHNSKSRYRLEVS